jgi:hypothetical protein
MDSCCGCKKLFSFAKEIKVTSFLANIVAFNPPTKINYIIEELKKANNKKNRGACYKEIRFIHKDYENLEINYPWIQVSSYQIQKCSTKKKIVLLHIKNTSKRDNKLTYIFSHGNACDLATIYPFLIDLSTQTKSDVISYDYSGYGRSEGSPSEKEICTDLEQVMDFVKTFLCVEMENIIM